MPGDERPPEHDQVLAANDAAREEALAELRRARPIVEEARRLERLVGTKPRRPAAEGKQA